MNKKEKTQRKSLIYRRKARWGYVFMAPWLIVFLVFYLYPLIYGIGVSFMYYNLKDMQWNGLENYIKIFTDYRFWRSLWGTIRYAVILIPIQVFLPLWAANTIQPHRERFKTLTKVLIYLPGVISASAMVVVWKFLLQPGTGLASSMLSLFGVEYFSIFDDANLSIPVLSVLMGLTGLGGNLIIYSAALGGISPDYYDAAELDGASRSQQFWNISFPLLHGTIVYVLVTSTIGTLQVFTIPKLMTAGGPNFTSSTLLMMIYDSAFNQFEFGYASALGVVLFLLLGAIAIVQFRLTQQEVIEY